MGEVCELPRCRLLSYVDAYVECCHCHSGVGLIPEGVRDFFRCRRLSTRGIMIEALIRKFNKGLNLSKSILAYNFAYDVDSMGGVDDLIQPNNCKKPLQKKMYPRV